MTTRKPKKEKAETIPTPDAAWVKARAQERGYSIAQISVLVSGHKDLLGRSLQGERHFKPGELAGLAKALAVPLSVLFERLGYEAPPTTVPLIGRVNEHGRVHLFAPEEVTEITAPSELTPDLLAVIVDAPNSRLAAYSGTIYYYERALGVRLDAIGRLAVIELGDLQAPVIGTIDQAQGGRGTVHVLGGIEKIQSRQIKSATPILWTKAA